MSEQIPPTESPSTLLWQRRLLPFLVVMLGGLTIFFFLISLQQLGELKERIEASPQLDLDAALHGADPESLSGTDRIVMSQWRARVYLEKNIVERRYHQANVLLLARTWTRYLGFITGMILALLGAAFILGKLREGTSELTLKTEAGEGGLKGQSPGLFLAFLGTALMITTIVTHNEIETKDAAIYTNMLINATPSLARTPPEPLDSLEVRQPAAAQLGNQAEGGIKGRPSIRSRMDRIKQKSEADTTVGEEQP